MKAIETTAAVTADHVLIVQVPVSQEVIPSEHRVIVVIDDNRLPQPQPAVWAFPVIDVGPWPEGLSLRREDMYGDGGR